QAEDGIRDFHVTGVQTCALPIWRIQVRVKRDGVRVEARAGYFAERDFAHTSRADRETQLQEQLFSPVSSTDIPVLVTGGYFRIEIGRASCRERREGTVRDRPLT